VTPERDWRFLYQLAAPVIVFLNETHPLCKTDNLLQMSYHLRVCHRITSVIIVSHRYLGVARNVTVVQ
jgi:hypothetical protein